VATIIPTSQKSAKKLPHRQNAIENFPLTMSTHEREKLGVVGEK